MWCACRAIADELSTSLRRQGMHLFCTYSKQRLARTFLKSGSALLSYIAFCLWISLGEQYLYLWAWAIHKFWIYTCEGCVLRLVKFCINHFSGWINVPSKNWELQKRQGKRLDPIPLVAPFHHGFHRLDRFPSFISRSIRAVFNRTGKKSNYKCNHQSSGTTCTTAQTQKYTVKWMHIFALDHFASWTQDFKVSMQRAREKCYFINLYIYIQWLFFPKTALGPWHCLVSFAQSQSLTNSCHIELVWSLQLYKKKRAFTAMSKAAVPLAHAIACLDHLGHWKCFL